MGPLGYVLIPVVRLETSKITVQVLGEVPERAALAAVFACELQGFATIPGAEALVFATLNPQP